MAYFSKNKGWDCPLNQDGSRTCTRFVVDKNNQKIATGTQVTLKADPSSNCGIVISGDTASIMDDEEKDIQRVQNMVVAGCKRGLA